jgi:uncharacterized protein YeaO (DUF488 family)
MPVVIKRAYEPAQAADGYRVLVDRLWPRGLTKEKLKLDVWMKEVSPSTELRKEFHHQAERWAEFQRRYFTELQAQPELIGELRRKSRTGTVTLVYAARDETRNNAAALKHYLEQKVP